MKLEGLKVNFLGDSITEGAGTTGKDKIYHALLAKKYGFEARNYGISGTRIARQKNDAYPPVDTEFCTRYKTMDDDADLVVVFGGTNDFGHGDAMFGHFTDRTNDTFYGACHVLMQGLIEKYPEARIVIMTPIHRDNEDSDKGDGTKPNGSLPLIDYVNAIKEVAQYYSLPVLDLWSVSGLQPKVPVIKEKYCPDGLHPNDAGHIKMAEVIGNFLLSI
jgi:lysophospholipase L1-like esterase